jgi:hypothetical protein
VNEDAMYTYRTTTKSLSARDGRVIAPSTKIDVLPWPNTVGDDGWRIAFLVEERGSIVTLSERDLRAHTEPCPA